MPTYTYDCPVCGHFERFLLLKDLKDEVWHDCPGWIGGCLSSLEIIVPYIEPLENCNASSYHPITGKRIEHGFWNHMVDGPRGDGYFPDRAKYKKWMKAEGLEEAGSGTVKNIVDKVMDQRRENASTYSKEKGYQEG